MKSLLSIVLLAAVALGQGTSPAPPSPSIPIDQENARKAKVLLDQMIQALGGPAYLNIQDMTVEGRSYTFHLGRPNSVGTLFWQFWKFPDKERVEFTKQRDVISIYNGDKGYEVTYKGVRQGDAQEVADYLRRREFSLPWVLRKWLNEPGVALFYDGTAVAGDKPAEQVTLMNARNQAVTIYIDTTTHLPIKKTFSWRDPGDKLRNEEGTVWDNYRSVQGIMTPYSITRFYNGDMAGQLFLNSVSYNHGLSDSLFEPGGTNKPQPKP